MRLSLQGGRPEIRREVIRGSAEQIIRVRVPVPGLFREAVFFLHEDVLRVPASVGIILLFDGRKRSHC